MTKTTALVIGTVFAAAIIAPVMVQHHRAKAALETENENLRAQLAQAAIPQVVETPPTSEATHSRDEHRELIRLRGEVASLRRQATTSRSNSPATSNQASSGVGVPPGAITEADVAEFFQRPLVDQAKLLGNTRGLLQRGGTPNEEWARNRALAEKVRPNLEQLESRPSDFADFQTAFIQSAIDLQDPTKTTELRNLIQSTYEKAVADHLDGPSRPEGDAKEWATRRDALDRQATRQAQQLLSAEERERFDRLFLGLMGIDLGTGDGAWHRFRQDDGTIVFPSEQAELGKP